MGLGCMLEPGNLVGLDTLQEAVLVLGTCHMEDTDLALRTARVASAEAEDSRPVLPLAATVETSPASPRLTSWPT